MPQSIGAASAPKVHTLFHLFSPGLVSGLICCGTPHVHAILGWLTWAGFLPNIANFIVRNIFLMITE